MAIGEIWANKGISKEGLAMALVPWKRQDIERPAASLQREMNRLFDDFFTRDFFVEPFRGMGEWRPALDVAETDTAIIVKADLPGLEVKDIDVSLRGDILTIKGQKKEEKEEKTKSYHRVERHFGSFERSVRLPAPVKGDQVEASFKDGVLNIQLPKTEEAKQKSIRIKVD
jgi:HSP20 family protein